MLSGVVDMTLSCGYNIELSITDHLRECFPNREDKLGTSLRIGCFKNVTFPFPNALPIQISEQRLSTPP